MKKKGRLGCWLGIGALALLLLFAVVAAVVYYQVRSTAFASRPLVLIHSPLNHEQTNVGDGVLVHATARSQRGLRRIEVWANDVLIEARDADEGQRPTTLVLSGSWVPSTEANHILIVRAIAANGAEGQASVVVSALERPAAAEAAPQTVEVAEGTGEGAAATGGEAAAPGGGEGEAQGGNGEEPADIGEAPVPEPGSEPPAPEGDAPDSLALLFSVVESVSPLPLGEAERFDTSSEPTGLRLEFLGLSTHPTLEQLHCYVAFAGAGPRSYPDQDNDQTTDESFTALSKTDVVNWSVEGLSGESMPVVSWPANQDLPISVWCVGIGGGGTDAIELGRWDGSVSSDRWTGMLLTGGVDSTYHFTYRITRTGAGPSVVPKYLDENMDSPTNVWLDESHSSLVWEYTQPADEVPITGFRIYLNDTYQWSRGSDIRESRLPYEWFHPLCGTTYTFGVSAFSAGMLDGPESYPTEVTLESDEDCQREISITFLTLETRDLGGDQEERFDGDVGPVYGHIYVNEERASFSGGSFEPGLGTPAGLNHNSTYSFDEWARSGEWQFSGSPQFVLPLEDEQWFEYGFHIMDRDSGYCWTHDSPGCNDLLCEGHVDGSYALDASQLDQVYEGEIWADNGRCRVTYRRAPMVGSPTGAGADASGIPLPWISVEDMEIAEGTGQVRLSVRNTGVAGWRDHDLVVELQSREGVSLGTYTWPGFVLEVGERAVLENPEMRFPAPFDGCVVIDPSNSVVEYREAEGVRHNPICPELPDLTIANVTFQGGDEGVGELHVLLENTGEGALEGRSVSLRIMLPMGDPLGADVMFRDVSIANAETAPLVIGGISSSMRGQMAGGYTMMVNPDGAIVESDATNNSFEVERAARLKFTWSQVTAPYQQRNSTSFELNADIVSGDWREPVVSWTIEDPNWGPDGCNSFRNCNLYIDNEAYQTDWFDIFGDEVLEVEATAISSMIIVGREIWSYDAGMDWGGGPLDVQHACGVHASSGEDAAGTHDFILEGRPGYYGEGVWWGTRFQICLEGVEL
jgi:hypothetical protein